MVFEINGYAPHHMENIRIQRSGVLAHRRQHLDKLVDLLVTLLWHCWYTVVTLLSHSFYNGEKVGNKSFH
jgi:hypothetical protein